MKVCNVQRKGKIERKGKMEITDYFTCYDLNINESFIIETSDISAPYKTYVCKLYIYVLSVEKR